MTAIRTTRRALLCAGLGAAAVPLVERLAAVPSIATARFDPPLGVCAGTASDAALAAAGADFVELSCQRDLAGAWSETEEQERLERLRALRVPARAANGFLPGTLRCTGPWADHDAVIAEATVLFRRAAAIGIDTITFGSAAARTPPEDFARTDAELQLVSLLARLAEPAHAASVVLCLEPLNRSETLFVNRVSEGLRLVRAVNHPNVRLTADLYHERREGAEPDDLRAAAPFIHHVHVAEVAGRRAPGTAGEDLVPHLRALHEGGFRGRVSIECRFDDLSAEAGPALRNLAGQIGAARSTGR